MKNFVFKDSESRFMDMFGRLWGSGSTKCKEKNKKRMTKAKRKAKNKLKKSSRKANRG